MNEEGEKIKETQCISCKYKDSSPRCMYQKNGKCSHYINKASLEGKE